MDPNDNLGIQRFLSPWDTHQLLIFGWYCNFYTHGYVLWYHSWCWLLIPYIHLYSRIILLYTLGQTLGLPRVSHSIHLPTLFTIYSVVYWAKRTLKLPCSLILSSCLAGAKDAHKVSPHFAQIWYFGLVSALAMAPINFSPGHVLDFTRQFQKPKAWFFTFVGCFTAYFCIRYFRSELLFNNLVFKLSMLQMASTITHISD